MSLIAVFDIGKTNKKFFLFDQNFQEVYRDYSTFDQIPDEDGFEGDDVHQLKNWMRITLKKAIELGHPIDAMNISSYGASFVHTDQSGQPVTPLYNYLKPFPEDLEEAFFAKYGPKFEWSLETASPPLGMLNSGLQIYWLKKQKPALFEKVHYAMHLPQYCSFLFSGKMHSDYTSVGCHTGLWSFPKRDYHDWVIKEGLAPLLPSITSTFSSNPTELFGRNIHVGVGIHDSSAALLPYILSNPEPFLLISTGTWSICLNPFNEAPLSRAELFSDCLQFMRVDGSPVKAARLFLGHEHKLQVKKLHQHFQKEYGYHRNLLFDPLIYQKLQSNYQPRFAFESIKNKPTAPAQSKLDGLNSFEEAYHQLMMELVALQLETIQLAKGNTKLNRIYLDGGFVDNDIFVKLLAHNLRDYELITTKSPLGSALGAALAVCNRTIDASFLLKHFALQKQEPVKL